MQVRGVGTWLGLCVFNQVQPTSAPHTGYMKIRIECAFLLIYGACSMFLIYFGHVWKPHHHVENVLLNTFSKGTDFVGWVGRQIMGRKNNAYFPIVFLTETLLPWVLKMLLHCLTPFSVANNTMLTFLYIMERKSLFPFMVLIQHRLATSLWQNFKVVPCKTGKDQEHLCGCVSVCPSLSSGAATWLPDGISTGKFI